jgi:hypothetical protein
VIARVTNAASVGTEEPSTRSQSPGSARLRRITFRRLDVHGTPVSSDARAAVAAKSMEVPKRALRAGTSASRSSANAQNVQNDFQRACI